MTDLIPTDLGPTAPGRRRGTFSSAARGPAWVVVPALLLLVVLFVWPIGVLLVESFSTPTWGLQHYRDLASDGVSLRILARTLQVAAIVTVVTLALGYPYAYVMSRVGPKTRGLMVLLALMPFWTSLMARTFAWFVLLQDNGVINSALQNIGIDGVSLIRNSTGVTIGMTQVLLPFMILPLYSSMSSIDPRLMTAARSLGAPPRKAFRSVFLPLSMPGVAAGVTVVYVTALGFYITPRLLGSPAQALISQQIGLKIDRLQDFAGAGALSLVLVVVTLALLGLAAFLVKLTTRGRPGGIL